MHTTHLHCSRRALANAALTPLVLVIAAACSREPAPVASPAPKPAVVAAIPAPATPAIAGLPADRMDCMGAGGIRFALDFNAAAPRAFEYASSNPADRSIVCRYLASDGDATSTWQRAADGKLTVELKEGATSGPATPMAAAPRLHVGAHTMLSAAPSKRSRTRRCRPARSTCIPGPVYR